MDYGRLYGMGSYFGEDYTATALVQFATATEMGRRPQGIGLTKQTIVLPDAVVTRLVSCVAPSRTGG